MADKDSQKAGGRRPSVSGALGRVLEQVQSEGFTTEKRTAALTGESRTAASGGQAAPRFFPTKGFAKVPATVCRPWALADRPDSEFGHLPDVARSLRDDGQIQPVVVRVLHDSEHPELRYEVIAGQVRWRAARDAGLDLEITIRELNDDAAFRLMVGENEFRRNLSDYARARRLAKALEVGLYKDKAALARSCGMSAPQLSYLLGFAELDPVIVGRLKDVGKISARLGYVLNAAVRDGYREAVLRDLNRIEAGEIGRDQIPGVWGKQGAVVDRPLVTLQPGGVAAKAPVQYRDQAGRVLFTVKSSGESGPVLRFSKAVQLAVDDALLVEIQALITKRLSSNLRR